MGGQWELSLERAGRRGLLCSINPGSSACLEKHVWDPAVAHSRAPAQQLPLTLAALLGAGFHMDKLLLNSIFPTS